jgi:3-oxoadipate CoA-transferase alpha subunit
VRNKKVESAAQAVEEVFDGAVILVGGFGRAGIANLLLDALAEKKPHGLTIAHNNSGSERTGIGRLIELGCVAKVITNFPVGKKSFVFMEQFEAGKVALELVPQGTMAERMRAAAAGLGGILTPTGVGTEIALGKKTVEVDGREFLLERPLHADFALVRADRVDPRGNLTYRMAARNFNPVMAMAAKKALVQANREVALGEIDPEAIVTPGLYVDRYYVATPPNPRLSNAF